MRIYREWCKRRFNVKVQAVIALFALSLALLSSRDLFAQANAGLTGTVTDPSGALVGGAKVTIANPATGIQTHTTTSSAGTYAVTGLTPGVYSITVEASGFKTNIQNSVNVEVSTTATVNVTLLTGAATETVEVIAESVSLNTTQPQLGSTIEPIVVRALPNEVSGRGRQIDALQFLAPGTTGSTFSHRVSGGVDFQQEIVYNGIPVPQPETQGYSTNFNPPFEMVDEFRVERSTFAAQFGLGMGAITYQMATGTNSYHGDLFLINRNSFFDSVGFFNGPAWGGRNSPPTDHENNYGFTIGGPVWIPKIYNGRDRTFFHYSHEWYKQNNEDTDVSTVPTALQKTGDFSDFVDGNTGAVIPIFDPTTGQQFQYNGRLNVIPPNRISPNSASLLQYIPDPDRPGSGIGGLTSNKSFAPFVNPHVQHVWGFTIEQVLTPKQRVRYSQWRNSFSNYSFDYHPVVIAPNPLNSMKYEPALGSGFMLNYNYAITPNLVMTSGFGWLGEINNQFNQTKYSFPAVAQGVIPTNILFDGQHAPTNWGTQGAWLQSINRKLGLEIVNNWLWTKGRHTFNIGGEWRRSYQNDNEEQTAGGAFNFSQRTTADPNNLSTTGSSFASFLLGLPDSANRSNSQELKLRNWDLSPYIQDDIKLSKKLTVNLGLRWDIMVPFTEVNNNVVFFNPNGTNPDAANLAGSASKLGNCTGCAGFDRADIHWGHFGPRLGVAYQLNSRTVLQGGFSIAFLNGGAYEYGTNKVAVNYGNLLVGSFTRGSTGGNTSSYGSWDTNIMPNPSATPFNTSLGRGTQINAFSRHDGFAPYAQQWNINIQHELPWNILVTGAWVGNRVIHLTSQLNTPNQLDPKYFAQYGNVLSTCPGNAGNSVLTDTFASGCAQADGFTAPYANFATDFGGSSTVGQSLTPFPQYSYIFNNFEGSGTTYYQGMQVQAEKRFTNGLSFLAGYTLSRLWDNTSSGFSSFTAAALNKYNQKPEWTVSGADEPNTFKVSGTYELPIGPNKAHFNNRGLTGQLLGGWQIGWILDYEAGQPLCNCNNSSGIQQNGDPYPGKSTSGPNVVLRPNRVSSVKLSTASYKRARDYFTGKISSAQMFNPAGFALTSSQYVLGDAERNYPELRGPALYNEAANVRKHFFFGERFQGILQIDYFNLFNRTQFQFPDSNVSNGTFGQVITQGAQTNMPTNRQGEVSFRLEF